MPVLVVKATEGFADRMTYLSHCIHYCLTFNTAICIDWSDYVWGGQQFDFHDIFELYGMKTMTKLQVVKLMATGKVKVNPPIWTAKDVWFPINSKTFEAKYDADFFEGHDDLHKIEGDVLVTNSKKWRGWHSMDLLNHVRIRPEIAERMRTLLVDFNPESLVVHLRGTDRYNDDFCKNAIDTAIQFPEDLPIYIVTDSLKLFDEFKEKVPRAKLVNPNGDVLKMPKERKEGTHLTNPEDLKRFGCDKKQMVIELLVDFVALWSAKYSLGYKESFFYKLARDYAHYPPNLMDKFLGFKLGTQP